MLVDLDGVSTFCIQAMYTLYNQFRLINKKIKLCSSLVRAKPCALTSVLALEVKGQGQICPLLLQL